MKKYRNDMRTSKNLEKALSDEALCHVKYMVWGEKAEALGYPEISEYYKTAARHELSHARIWMEELGLNRSLNENLQEASNSSNEISKEYYRFASDAEDEGFDVLGNKFHDAALATNDQKEMFIKASDRLVSDEMYIAPPRYGNKAQWSCYNCGFVSEGETPPDICPLCSRPQTWFVLIDADNPDYNNCN